MISGVSRNTFSFRGNSFHRYKETKAKHTQRPQKSKNACRTIQRCCGRARARPHNGPTHLTCVGLCVAARARPQHLGVVLRVFLLFCGAQKPSNQKSLPAGSVRAARATRLAGFSCLGVSTPRGPRRSLVAGSRRRHRRLGQTSPHLAGTFVFNQERGGKGNKHTRGARFKSEKRRSQTIKV